ncbi:MAG TPA: hypothetical protein VFG09_08665 [Thermodesulfovibrionales bacterium]|jgi:hypothetical protein|nr:hypothetical protein [Thermodesulfovibrionales bacterium]
MNDLINKIVDVTANEIVYTGRLVEMNEVEVYLEGETGWIVIPIEQVTSITEKN